MKYANNQRPIQFFNCFQTLIHLNYWTEYNNYHCVLIVNHSQSLSLNQDNIQEIYYSYNWSDQFLINLDKHK